MAELTLYYDGQCPICRSYRDYVAVRRTVDLELRDARQHGAEIAALADEGHDINQGMILVTPDAVLHGADAIVAVRAYTRGRGFGDAVVRTVLKAPWLVRMMYPFARGVRHLLLGALGRSTRIDP
jgi:predicted DCC family thiol-disulfide oxidoreductase YuxK